MAGVKDGFVRVRFNRRGEAELSAEDLRKTGHQDLVRLAEADRKDSTSLFVRGNEDGWLSPAEVDRVSGLHFSIIGGYQAIVGEAEQSRAERIPVSDVVRLMQVGGSGPIRLRTPPKAEATPKDPILEPRRYDATKATPLLLKAVESSIEGTISKRSAKVYRGFALPDYGGAELVRYLMGDWRCVIASHTFSEKLREKLSKRGEFHDAVARTAQEIGAQIVREVVRDGYGAYATAQSRATQIGVHGKKATGMASYLDSPTEGPMMTPTSFGYAGTGFLGLISDRTLPATHPKIMLEVEQKVPAGYDHAEYYIPSHVPPTKVNRFFLGFSNWNDAREYLVPPDEQTSWYQVEILRRDEEGRPSAFQIRTAEVVHTEGGLMEEVTLGKERWRSSQADSKGARAFAEQHPNLAPTIQEITRQLALQ